LNIYFTEANREASRFDRTGTGISRFAGLLSQLGANLYTLEWRTGFPLDADLVVIAGPMSELLPDQIARLWSYLSDGGNLLMLADTFYESGTSRALPSTNGLFNLMWVDMGLRGLDDVVVTTATGSLPAPGETPRSATDTPLITNFTTTLFGESPLTANLTGELAFFTARSFRTDSATQGYNLTPLVFTNNQFYGESDLATYNSAKTYQFDIGKDTTAGQLPLAVAFENQRLSVRGVVIGDRQFATNGAGLQTAPSYSSAFLYPNNARFLVNAVSWLLERETTDFQFPTPGPTETVTITPSPTLSPTPTVAPTATPAA
jgi:hypothetical protein